MQFAAGAPNVLVGSGTGEVRGSSHSQTKIDNFFKLRSSSINAITETDYWLRSQRGKKLMFVCCINQLNWYLPEIEFCSEKWRCWVRNCTCDRRHLKEGAQFCQLSPQPQLQPQSQPLNKNISAIAKAACLLGWNLSQFLNSPSHFFCVYTPVSLKLNLLERFYGFVMEISSEEILVAIMQLHWTNYEWQGWDLSLPSLPAAVPAM